MMHNHRSVKILVIGAGQVGTTIIEALGAEHSITVVDTDPARLSALSYRYDVLTMEGNGASRRVLQEAGIAEADLVIACTSRDEVNIVAGILAERLSPDARTIVRTQNVEYLEVWRERQLDVDFVVSSELETANAIARLVGIPAARQTDVFAEGQVLMVEFDVPPGSPIGRDGRSEAARRGDPPGLEGREHHQGRPDDRRRAGTSRSSRATG